MAARSSVVTVRQIIGLWCPDDTEWRMVRTLQYAGLIKHSFLRPAVLAFACMAMIGLMARSVPPMLLYGWAGTLLLAWGHKSRFEDALERQGIKTMSRGQFRHHAFAIGLGALIWVAPLIVFARFLDDTVMLAVWTLIAMLIAGATASRTSIPMATILFITITGGVAAVCFLLRGNIIVGMASLGFTIITALAALESARLFLTASTAEAGVAESREVVSLLLREFEEDEGDWLWHIDLQQRIYAPSDRFAYALGADPSAIDGQSFIQLIAGRQWDSGKFSQSLQDLVSQIDQQQPFSNLLVQVDQAGGRRWWKLSGTPTQNSHGQFSGYRGVGSDVTEQREAEERIAYQAQYDGLTGLPNRSMIIESLATALVEARRWHGNCAFLMIDLDRFKAVNDSLGHATGDRLLVQVAERLRDVVGDAGQCGRLGGDEFATVLYDIKERQDVSVIAEAIIEQISRPFEVDGYMLTIGASVGSAIGPKDGDAVETLMHNADLALYEMKRGGRGGHHVFEPELQQDQDERQQLEEALRCALPNNELDLRFQPVVNAAAGNILGFEALLRWIHPERGSVGRDVFVALAEETRLITDIGEWVLRQACWEAMRWEGDIKVYVNVSGVQLRDPDFVHCVVRALYETRLPPRRLEIEINEHVFRTDAQTVREALEDLLALGCSLALDDFGTGHSSLRNLRSMNFSTVKIDRSFVQAAARGSAESLAVIRAVVAMAQSLQITTVAEGVETIDEIRVMRSLGCEAIQGFYFGRPMAAGETLALVDSSQGKRKRSRVA